MESFEVSRITVRQALSDLAQEGYVVGKRGIGTIITYRKIDEKMKSVISFSDEMKNHGITMKTSYCEVDKINDNDDIKSELKCDTDSNYLRIVRVRCADDNPIVYSLTYVNNALKLSEDKSSYLDSFYKYLSEEKNIIVAKARDTLEASLADETIAKFLNIEKNDPVFIRTRRSYTKEDYLIEYTICYYPGKKYKYSIDL